MGLAAWYKRLRHSYGYGVHSPYAYELVERAVSPEKKKEYEKHVKKSEEIFRKQFEREADRILSKVYNSEYMGASEKNFMASSKKIFAELTEVQQRLAGEANLTNEKSQVIATQIIDKITEEKKKNLVKYGIQKGENE